MLKPITINNCCNGKLGTAFNDAIARAAADIDERGAFCLDTRKIVLTVELTPNDQGYVEQVCYADVRLPKMRYGGMAKVDDSTGKMNQIVDGQLDAFDQPEKKSENQEEKAQ